ncbi:hypothetical protein TSAR_002957 [Trichomalopsis sarcophagae]|uniref:RETREG1-3/ARL6IP-like N-terminal reticulon-homology domain-containing protein n=1 Tax=Trichomalopsis sarcophagae TaxID=543379 RepID=A0A232FN04_9HYME|nr:hypothetical protein TSAR_002957 [Trichomalopsis sarcophagae]
MRSRLSMYFSWGWPGSRAAVAAARAREEEAERERLQQLEDERRRSQCQCDFRRAFKRLLGMIESLLLWENTCNSVSVIIAFNILFWEFVVLEERGFAAASSAALVVVLCYSTLETQEEGAPTSAVSQSKAEQLEKLLNKAKSSFESLVHLQQDQPRVFCTGLCVVSLGLWLVGRYLDNVLLAYTICMGILLGPALLLRLPSQELSIKEWDLDIEEFLPAVTEDNLQVLKRAGENGDRSPTPPSPDMDASTDNFDEDLVGLRMPSHEDVSTDGLELIPELDMIIDDSMLQNELFDRGSSSSSDDEVDIGLSKQPRKQLNDDDGDDSDDSDDSEFEIIDTQELDGLKNA